MAEFKALENPVVSSGVELPAPKLMSGLQEEEGWVLDIGDLVADARGEVVDFKRDQNGEVCF